MPKSSPPLSSLSPTPKRPGWVLPLLVGAGVLGVGAFVAKVAIAVPEMTAAQMRLKTTEARINVAKIFDAAAGYYGEHERCPGAADGAGRAGTTPPLVTACSQGDGKACAPGVGGGDGYDSSLWTENPAWSALNFSLETPHAYHYDFRWAQSPDGTCTFTAQAFGDLDDDGVFSTFESFGVADRNGVESPAGLYIVQELE